MTIRHVRRLNHRTGKSLSRVVPGDRVSERPMPPLPLLKIESPEPILRFRMSCTPRRLACARLLSARETRLQPLSAGQIDRRLNDVPVTYVHGDPSTYLNEPVRSSQCLRHSCFRALRAWIHRYALNDGRVAVASMAMSRQGQGVSGRTRVRPNGNARPSRRRVRR